ncbi:MAG: hypothetical protein KOO63_06270 [Bacteroidales bacterium]|nr:hypothetical protein [Candidatus Latescibacterota bacterium]
MKENCWEVMDCGREPGGAKEKDLGVCAAATNFTHNGKNGGKGAGRYCWKVAGTLCGGKVQGSFVDKMANCSMCKFFQQVKTEEATVFQA